MRNAIEIRDLQKSYDGFNLNVSLTIPEGIITGLIGENGAGKTTLIKLILNIIKRDSGVIKIRGLDNIKEEDLAKEDIGVVLDNMFFPELLNCNDINKIMKGIYKNWDSELFYKYLKDFNLNPNKAIKDNSKGMRKKIETKVTYFR